MDAGALLRVPFRFFNFTDHSIVHGVIPFHKQVMKKARKRCVPLIHYGWMKIKSRIGSGYS
jgi:hypothetical protein